MIYECPNCQTPQEAGQTICPHCHAQFDGPVPSDAIVPPIIVPPIIVPPIIVPPIIVPPIDAAALSPAAAAPEEAAAAAPSDAPSEPAAAEPAPTLVEVPPPPSSQPAPNTQPYFTAQAYTPPSYESPEPVRSPFGGLSRALLIAFPLVLVLVLGGVFYTNSLNTNSDTTPVTLPPARPSAAPLPAAPVTSPTYLQGAGNTNNASNDPRAKLLAGRWASKSGDYYVFNSDGTGSRGNPVKQQPEQAFLWGLVQNRLMLYMDKNEMLRFNAGPDDNTIFLGGQIGSYVQYSRSKTT